MNTMHQFFATHLLQSHCAFSPGHCIPKMLALFGKMCEDATRGTQRRRQKPHRDRSCSFGPS